MQCHLQGSNREGSCGLEGDLQSVLGDPKDSSLVIPELSPSEGKIQERKFCLKL